MTEEKQDRLFNVLFAWRGNKINFNNTTGQTFLNLRKKKQQLTSKKKKKKKKQKKIQQQQFPI